MLPSPDFGPPRIIPSRIDPALVEARARALQTVETVFACLVLVCVSAGLAVHLWADSLGLAPDARLPVSFGFLSLALADLAMLVGCRAFLSRNP